MAEYLAEVRRVRAMPRSTKPQLPHSDYVRFASSLAGEMDILPSQSLRKRHRMFVPALFAVSKRHMSSDASAGAPGDGDRVMNEMNEMMEKYKNGYGIALHIFQSLSGRWSFERSLVSQLDSSPSGTVRGQVDFTPLSAPIGVITVEQSEDAELSSTMGVPFTSKSLPDLLYEENGVFQTNQGFSFDVSRRYIYTYNVTNDSLDIYFAKPSSPDATSSSNSLKKSSDDDGNIESVLTAMTIQSTPTFERDYLFVSLSFAATPDGWLGTACHPCGQDLYNSRFLFALKGVFLDSMKMEYTVNGPHKDYLSITYLKR